jgi:hypothetical protein
VQVDRKNGADGKVTVAFKTTEINAIADKDYMSNYILKLKFFFKKAYFFFKIKAKTGILEFKHGEITKTIPITIIDGKF